MSQHSLLSGLELHQPFHYIQEGDPGAIGAEKFWLKLSTGTISVRNSLNSGWIEVGANSTVDVFTDLNDVPSAYTGGSGKLVAINVGETGLEFIPVPPASLPQWLTEVPENDPVSPNAKDDEFNAGSLNGKWTWENQGTATVSFASGKLGLLVLAAANNNVKSLLQSAPATPWTITTKFALTALGTNGMIGGLVLRESSSGKLYIFGLSYQTGLQLRLVRYNSNTSENTTPFTGFVAFSSSIYLRITDNGTNLLFSISYEGSHFIQVTSDPRTTLMAGGPNQFGIAGNANQNSVNILLAYDFFRVT